jgi:hypothetical protein
MLVEQLQDAVDDCVLGLGEEVWLREGGFRNAGAGILAAELGDDVVEVLLRAEALPASILPQWRQSPTCWRRSLLR